MLRIPRQAYDAIAGKPDVIPAFRFPEGVTEAYGYAAALFWGIELDTESPFPKEVFDDGSETLVYRAPTPIAALRAEQMSNQIDKLIVVFDAEDYVNGWERQTLIERVSNETKQRRESP